MPLSNIVPIVDLDFSNPAQSNAVTGINFTPPTNVDLSTFYPGMPPLYFARTGNLKSTKVYIDKGVVLESESNSTQQIETFAFALELPAGGHSNDIYILVQFDVGEVILSNMPFLGAVAAVATETPMKTGDMDMNDRLQAATCQMRHDAGPPKDTKFRLNAPQSTGGQVFQYTPFDFFRPVFHRPIPATTEQVAFADNSIMPLELELTMSASPDPATKADVEVNLSQHDAAALKYFVHPGGNKFKSNVYKNSLAAIGFAGASLSITRPQGLDPADVTNPGPARVRIRRLAIYYA